MTGEIVAGVARRRDRGATRLRVDLVPAMTSDDRPSWTFLAFALALIALAAALWVLPW